MKKISLFIATQFILSGAAAQISNDSSRVPRPGVLDGVYVKEFIATKHRTYAYRNFRNSSNLFKRVWSKVDSNQYFYHSLYSRTDTIHNENEKLDLSAKSLWSIIRYHVMRGDLTLYAPNNSVLESLTDGDAFKYPMKSETNKDDYHKEIFRYFGTVRENELDTSQNYDTVRHATVDIIQYRFQVNWCFDRERSVLDRHIIGISPLIYVKDKNGNITGTK